MHYHLQSDKVYSENQEQKAEQKHWSWYQRTLYKTGIKGSLVVEINGIQKKPSTLIRDKNKDTLSGFKESVWLHPPQVLGYKSINLVLQKRTPEPPAQGGPPKELVPWDSFYNVQKPGTQKPPTTATVQGGVATAQAHGRLWHDYANFIGMQSIKVVGLGRLPPRIQRKT